MKRTAAAVLAVLALAGCSKDESRSDVQPRVEWPAACEEALLAAESRLAAYDELYPAALDLVQQAYVVGRTNGDMRPLTDELEASSTQVDQLPVFDRSRCVA